MSRLEFNLFMLLPLPIFLVALISNSAMAQPLHTFKNGEVADAEKINENFDTIYDLAGGDRGDNNDLDRIGGDRESTSGNCPF